MDAPPPIPDPALAGRAETLRRTLGAEVVDDFLAAAAMVGSAYLPGDEDLVFGFVQRMLARLKLAGRNRGLLYPKFDAHYNRMFDYMDADGAIWVLRPGDGPGEVPNRPSWFHEHDAGDPERRYFGLVPGAELAIALAFLAAWADLRARQVSPPASA